jgi:hypothetical protein
MTMNQPTTKKRRNRIEPMSIKVMSEIWANDEFAKDNKAKLLVALALADFCNDEGWAWPAVETLAKKARCTVRGTQKILRELESDGFLDTQFKAGSNHTNLYKFKTKVNPVHGERDDTTMVSLGSPKPSYEPSNLFPKGAVAQKSRARPESETEVIAYCKTRGLTADDGSYIWNNWLANGFTRNRHPIKDWHAAIVAWQLKNHFPSQQPQRGSRGTNGKEPFAHYKDWDVDKLQWKRNKLKDRKYGADDEEKEKINTELLAIKDILCAKGKSNLYYTSTY